VNTREFIQQFLGSDEQGIEEAHLSLRKFNDVKPQHQHLLVVALIIFRYRLLDIFADVLDVPRHPKFSVVPQMSKPKHTVGWLDRVWVLHLTPHYNNLIIVIQIFENLRHWPQVILNFLKIHERRQGQAFPNNDIAMEVDSSTSECCVFHAGVQTLMRTHQYKTSTLYSKIMYNIKVLVFCLWWFGAVHLSV
jgi:hypothetical protein